MPGGFVVVPPAPRVVLRDARVPRCLLDGAPAGLTAASDELAQVDLALHDGLVAAVRPPASAPLDGEAVVDLTGGQVWPGFVDVHTHLDKGHIWPRAENPDGTFAGAMAAVEADRAANWTAEDIARRMEFGLRCAYAHGTVALRTHLDSLAPQHRVSWPVFRALRQAWQGRIALQASSIVMLDRLTGPFGDELADLVADAGGILGVVTAMTPGLDGQLDRLFALAESRGLDLDLHADESGDAGAATLRHIARAGRRSRFTGRVLIGHCCSLAVQPADEVERTLDLVAAAGLAVVSLPLCNLYLQGRLPGQTPRWRGVTLLHELRARGIPVALASDNCRDPFHAYGDLDPLEVFSQAARIAHLDRPIGTWPAAVTRVPADLMGRPDAGRVAVGCSADLVLFSARSYSELLSRPQADRVVLRAGRTIETTLPDYRELDDLFGRRTP
ncbi:MAG: cytosine deaminase [Candidatus Rokuibacteriota bacterium]